MFNNLKIGARLAVGFGALLALLAAIAFLGVSQTAKVNDTLRDVVGDKVVKSQLANDLAMRAMDNARLVRNLILNPIPADRERNKAKYDANKAANDEALRHYESIVASVEGKAMLKAVHEALADYRAFSDDVVTLALADKTEEARQLLYGERYKVQAVLFDALKVMREHEAEKMTQGAASAEANYQGSRSLMIGLALAAFALGAGVAFWITRSIVTPLHDAVTVATRSVRGRFDGSGAPSLRG